MHTFEAMLKPGCHQERIGLITVLTSRKLREKLQCLYENLMSKHFGKTAVPKKKNGL